MKVECELIRAQNSLIRQSEQDEDGNKNVHGWGLAAYSQGKPYVRKQPMPAYESEDFRLEAGELFSDCILAHVRHATVEPMAIENTHPFQHDNLTFIHNGEIVEFNAVRPLLLDAMLDRIRATIEGNTDSEFIFRYLVTLHELQPKAPLSEILEHGVRQVLRWTEKVAPYSEVSLNIILTDGQEMVGTRYGRALWYVERNAVRVCEVCGCKLHVNENPGADYRAVVVASERLTKTEEWTEIPEASLFRIDADVHFEIQPLGSGVISSTSAS